MTLCATGEFVKRYILLIGLFLLSQSTLAQSQNTGDWSLKFHFGFSRINYLPTEVNMNSTQLTGTLNTDFIERTSAHWYNPFEKGRKIDEIFKWFDEPSNTMSISLENEKNAFYLTALHPKYHKTFLYKSDGQGGVAEFAPIEESDKFEQQIPSGYALRYIGETHKRMDWSIGYGRKISLFKSGNMNIKYIPRVELGVSTGKSRSVRIIPGEAWEDYYGKPGIHGGSVAAGHRIEIEKGRLSLYIDQKLVYSEQEHEFFDGTVEYKLVYIPTTFGVSYKIFQRKKE